MKPWMGLTGCGSRVMDDRYAQVTPEGRYVKPPRKEMSYGALIGTRAALVSVHGKHAESISEHGANLWRSMCLLLAMVQVKTAVDFQKKALMIGIRYAAMRVQGTVEEEGQAQGGRPSEMALLDYPIHMNKLITLLAASYAWHFQASYVLKLNDQLEEGAWRRQD